MRRLNGTVNANGDSTTVTFEYGTDTSYGMIASGVPKSGDGYDGYVGLRLPERFNGRTRRITTGWSARTALGTTYGADMTFVTCVPPTASTLPAGAVESTSATLNGTVNAHDTTTAVAFEYGLNAGYGTTVPGSPDTVTGNADIPVSAVITGLTREYHLPLPRDGKKRPTGGPPTART